MSLVNEQHTFLQDACVLIAFAAKNGFQVTGGELFRTPEQQDFYVKAGLSKTKNSYHLKRLAIDLNFFKNGKYITDKATLQVLGDYWESLSSKNSWGGNWKTFIDTPHFERRTA